MQKWVKHGCLFQAQGQYDWMQTHAQLPVADAVSANVLRIYFASRDKDGRSRIGFVEVSSGRPHQLLRVSQRPVLDLGELGCFDDQGVLPSSIVNWNGTQYLYYIGVNTATNIAGRAAIGVAESRDGGETFTRVMAGPIVERGGIEAHLCTSPYVLPGAPWRMWYTSGTEWVVVDDKPEPCYLIRQTTSSDGLRWQRPGEVAVSFQNESEGGLGRPAIFYDGNIYRMWFSARGKANYRQAGPSAYRMAYAESMDGSKWQRLPMPAELAVEPGAWDSDMIAYPHVFRNQGKLEMLYNGNGFGQSGFGYATLEEVTE